jgi:hypothetical protein
MKHIILITILLALAAGCVTQRRCLVKFPPDTITRVETSTVTEYRDTIIEHHIPGDSVFVYDTTFLIMDGPEPLTIEPLTVRLPLAHSSAWIDDGRLNLGLWIDSTTLQFKIDSAKATVKVNTLVSETKIVKVPAKIPRWKSTLFWFCLWGFVAMVVVLIVSRKFR